jgi:uncharacterized protein YcbX
MRVTALWTTPVKGTRLHAVDSVELEKSGAAGNRRFFLADAGGRMVNGKGVGELQTIIAELEDPNRLTLRLPDGSVLGSEVTLGEPETVRFFSRQLPARPVAGAFSAALSSVCGRELRLMQGERTAVDRGASGGVSLISRASLERLAREAATDAVDPRRFRMLIEVNGVEAHEEDGWVGRRVRLGQATVRFAGHVGRCLVTNRAPDSGRIDFDTLDTLLNYRLGLQTTEPVAFGIYGAVASAGPVRLGDPVVVDG